MAWKKMMVCLLTLAVCLMPIAAMAATVGYIDEFGVGNGPGGDGESFGQSMSSRGDNGGHGGGIVINGGSISAPNVSGGAKGNGEVSAVYDPAQGGQVRVKEE